MAVCAQTTKFQPIEANSALVQVQQPFPLQKGAKAVPVFREDVMVGQLVHRQIQRALGLLGDWREHFAGHFHKRILGKVIFVIINIGGGKRRISLFPLTLHQLALALLRDIA